MNTGDNDTKHNDTAGERENKSRMETDERAKMRTGNWFFLLSQYGGREQRVNSSLLVGLMGGSPNVLQSIGVFRPQYGNTPTPTDLYDSVRDLNL